ncbi:MAG: HlyC/CorC family transporter [Candidatus Melainabacteria bacterium]|nr:HlyC/CorC family transporter [Candidatus Melainabacteria bacterium]
MFTLAALAALFFLIGSSTLTALSTALHRKGRLQAEESLKHNDSPFFFRHFLKFFFGTQKWEGLLFSLSFTKHLLRIGFVLTAFFYLIQQPFFRTALTKSADSGYVFDELLTLAIAAVIIISSLIIDFLFSLFGQTKPKQAFQVLSPIASLYLLLCIPLTAPFFRILKLFLPKAGKDKKFAPTFKIREKVHELLQETELGAYLDPTEQKFILSIVSFKERIAREVMVPRISLFSLPDDTPIQEAAPSFLEEGYSRIPVYKDSVDNIIGVLLYKDVLKIYLDKNTSALSTPVGKLVKPVLYTPETKKISHLLQEFRSKQIHMAIVVDEWGGTEGIVTIEDILEELVGEIADEYDIGQQNLFSPLPGGGWVVDAKMSIIDIQEELGIDIPQSPEYDTIGGYVYHRAGAIPSKGWRIHHDEFDLEVLSSSERAVEKIKITTRD